MLDMNSDKKCFLSYDELLLERTEKSGLNLSAINELFSKYSNRIKLCKPWCIPIPQNNGVNMFYVPLKTHIYIPYSFPRLSHEVAHMVEMTNNSRLVMIDWGMPVKIFKKAPGILALLSRETRVRVIEDVLVGRKPNISTVIEHSYMSKMFPQVIGNSRFKEVRDVENWIEDLHERTLKAWSFDRIMVECHKRMEYILNWMETSESQNLAA